jgi:hypothetical protein
LNWHPHLHVLAPAGAFRTDGSFVHSRAFDTIVLRGLFQANVLTLLLKERMISPELVERMREWRHSGFHAYTGTLPRAPSPITEKLVGAIQGPDLVAEDFPAVITHGPQLRPVELRMERYKFFAFPDRCCGVHPIEHTVIEFRGDGNDFPAVVLPVEKRTVSRSLILVAPCSIKRYLTGARAPEVISAESERYLLSFYPASVGSATI